MLYGIASNFAVNYQSKCATYIGRQILDGHYFSTPGLQDTLKPHPEGVKGLSSGRCDDAGTQDQE